MLTIKIPLSLPRPFFLGMALLVMTAPVSAQSVRINEFTAHSMYIVDDSVVPSGDWRQEGFNDSPWGKSVLPIGADQGPNYDLAVNLFSQVNGLVSTIYVRSKVNLASDLANSDETAVLDIDYDDAFVLYINGVEVVRNNVGYRGLPPKYWTIAKTSHPASNDSGNGVDRTETFDLGKASTLFKSGVNTMAIMVFNESLSSSDMFLDLSLKIGTTVITDPAARWAYLVGTGEPDEVILETGIDSDWIELFNASDAAVSLEGWSLTDDFSMPRKWVFPEIVMDPKSYLLVFASGEDVRDPTGKLETSFKLSASGEYLGLYDAGGNVVSDFAPEYPEQPIGCGYGWSESTGSYRIYLDRTPGSPNSENAYIGETGDTAFSIDRGFYDDPFEVEITTETEGATIRYTTDGSTPTETNGMDYTSPVPVSTTTILRARAFKEDYLPSNTDTHTYIFVDDVIQQDNTPEGFPAMLKYAGHADLPADYEMDPEVTEDPLYRDQLRDALLSIPSVSIVTDIDNLYDRSIGLYQNPTEHGEEWERPVSMEYLHPNGKEGFQVDAGMRVQGGHTRDPSRSPKHSFRVAFRSEYGPAKLDYRMFPEPDSTKEIDTVILRAHGNQSWTHHNGFRGDNRGRAQYIRDQFAKDMQGKMGSPTLHNAYAFLYLNGVFWGLYNPTERATAGYGEAYFGGDKEDYDALNSGEILDGNAGGWNILMSLVDQDLSDPTFYQQITEILDVKAFTDYMLVNHWGGNEDWDDHNWYSLRNRLNGKWYFFLWDSEFFFETATANVTDRNSNNHPGEIFHSLIRNAEYRLLLADRIYYNFYNGGPLTTEVALSLWEDRSAQVYRALVAESARWGDNRRDVNRMTGPYELYTRDNQWKKERQRVVETIIPVRNEVTLSQYSGLNFLLPTPAPEFSQQRGVLTADHPLQMSTDSTASPVIYYTLDGSDPRVTGGDVSSTARVYSLPVSVSERTTVKARVKDNAGWGPLHEAEFYPAGDPADLQISEILYAPLVEDTEVAKDFEFVEIRNSGPAPVSLDKVELSSGINFAFPASQVLDPGKRIVVVSNIAKFSAQHPEVSVAGEYTGNLSNTGERITLKHEDLGIIQQVVYSDWYPWPEKAAREGYSLVPVSLNHRGEPTHSTAWKAGVAPGGTPGTGEAVNANWIEHESLGWVYSETGTAAPGNWVYGAVGYMYIGSEDPAGNWVWFRK